MAVSEAEDKEAAELVRPVWDISEVSGVVVLGAEGSPDPEEGACGFA